jgi:tRNA G18 (ribose-2'-O)-methylase SpoU
LSNEEKIRKNELDNLARINERRFNLQYMGIIIVLTLAFLAIILMGTYKWPEWTIRLSGFVAFIMLFEFIILILDQITDPHNLGAIVRSAVCLGADGIVIPRHNTAEVNHTVMKTSSGAVNYISIAKETNLTNAILFLKNNGYWIAGTDLQTNKIIYETDFKIPLALIIGSEGSGMRDNLKKQCDILVRIPMAGKIGSLNASVSAGIVLYEIFRQKNIK